MGNPDGDTERGLPVSVALVTGKVEIPVGHAVQFAENPAAAVLTGSAGRLLNGGKFDPVAEHVNPGQLE